MSAYTFVASRECHTMYHHQIAKVGDLVDLRTESEFVISKIFGILDGYQCIVSLKGGNDVAKTWWVIVNHPNIDEKVIDKITPKVKKAVGAAFPRLASYLQTGKIDNLGSFDFEMRHLTIADFNGATSLLEHLKSTNPELIQCLL